MTYHIETLEELSEVLNYKSSSKIFPGDVVNVISNEKHQLVPELIEELAKKFSENIEIYFSKEDTSPRDITEYILMNDIHRNKQYITQIMIHQKIFHDCDPGFEIIRVREPMSNKLVEVMNFGQRFESNIGSGSIVDNELRVDMKSDFFIFLKYLFYQVYQEKILKRFNIDVTITNDIFEFRSYLNNKFLVNLFYKILVPSSTVAPFETNITPDNSNIVEGPTITLNPEVCDRIQNLLSVPDKSDFK